MVPEPVQKEALQRLCPFILEAEFDRLQLRPQGLKTRPSSRSGRFLAKLPPPYRTTSQGVQP